MSHVSTVTVKTTRGPAKVEVNSFDTERVIRHNIKSRHDDAQRRDRNERQRDGAALLALRQEEVAEREAEEIQAKTVAAAFNDDEIRDLLIFVKKGQMLTRQQHERFEQKRATVKERHRLVEKAKDDKMEEGRALLRRVDEDEIQQQRDALAADVQRLREATVAGTIPDHVRLMQRKQMRAKIVDPEWRPWREPAPGKSAMKQAARLQRKQQAQAKERRQQSVAATKIQSHHRGKKARHRVRELELGRAQATAAVAKGVEEAAAQSEAATAATKIQSRHRGKEGRRKAAREKAELTGAATKIQSRHRGRRVRKKARARQENLSTISEAGEQETKAATQIQSRHRGKLM